jgi:tetratricopeptide (TPR) repeat protein
MANLASADSQSTRKSATDWLQKGVVLAMAGKNQEALEAFTKAIELNPKYAEAYNNRVIAYLKLGNYQQAIRDYDKAIKLDPKNAMAYSKSDLMQS